MAEGRAIPFIMATGKLQYEITEEAKEFLNSIDEPLGIIAICGKYRTGKSYFVNHMLLDLPPHAGFGVGPTINPCTKGVWIWTELTDTVNEWGEPLKVLVVDTEGLGAYDEDQNHDTRIFLLALLLSSYFVFNSMGSIDENAIQSLSLIINLSKKLASEDPGNEEDVARYFPSFLWILRDFSLQLKDHSGHPITLMQYFENSLMPTKGMSEAAEQKNRVRRLIKHYFKERECFSFVRPVENETDLQDLESSAHLLRPEFKQQVLDLRKVAFGKIRTKKINGTEVNGPNFCALAESYVDAINKGGVPNIESSWIWMCRNENEKIIEALANEYSKNFWEEVGKLPVDDQVAEQAHEDHREEAGKSFRQQAVGEEEMKVEYAEELNKELEERFGDMVKQNNRATSKACDQILDKKIIEFKDSLKSSEYTNLQSFVSALDTFGEEFLKTGPKGKIAVAKLKEFKEKMLLEGSHYIAEAAEMVRANEKKLLAEQIKQAEDMTKKKQAEIKKEKVNWEALIGNLKAQNKHLEEKEVQFKEKFEELVQKNVKNEEEQKQRMLTMKNQYDAKLKEANAKIKELEGALDKSERAHTKTKKESQSEKSLLTQEVQYKKEEIFGLNKSWQEQQTMLDKLKNHLKKLMEDKGDLNKKQQADMVEEHKRERLNLENQVNSLTRTIEDQRVVQDTIKGALEMKLTGDPNKDSVVETNKYLSRALDKVEDRCNQFEAKIGDLKPFKAMIKRAKSLQCELCNKVVLKADFLIHLEECSAATGAPGSVPNPFSLTIGQTILQDSVDSRPYTAYEIQVKYRGRTWKTVKQHKMFYALHKELTAQYPAVAIPPSTKLNQKSGKSMFSRDAPVVLEERRKGIEEYVNELASNAILRESKTFENFIGFEENQASPDPPSLKDFEMPGSNRYRIDSPSEFEFLRQLEGSFDDSF